MFLGGWRPAGNCVAQRNLRGGLTPSGFMSHNAGWNHPCGFLYLLPHVNFFFSLEQKTHWCRGCEGWAPLTGSERADGLWACVTWHWAPICSADTRKLRQSGSLLIFSKKHLTAIYGRIFSPLCSTPASWRKNSPEPCTCPRLGSK